MGRQLLLIVIAIVHGVRSLSPSSTQQRRGTSTTALRLNRIFCELNEVTDDDHLHFPKDDYRFDHIIDILRLKAGDTLKVGVLDVGKTDAAEVRSMSEHAITVALGPRAGWATNVRPRVDLILAVPRPLRLERILPVVSCVGVGRLVLIGASKVQADYFGSHLFRRPEELRKGLVEGLSQAASDCLVPDVLVRRNLKKWLTSPEFNDMFPPDTYQKVVAHPPSATLPGLQPLRIADLPKGGGLASGAGAGRRIVVAVGPEGGWEDDEVQMLAAKGFHLCSLGDRILRTDMAVPVLLGLAHDWLASP